MATTYDLTADAAAAIPALDNEFINRIGPVRITVPLAGITTDVLKCIPVKAGWKVWGVMMKQVTQGAGTTITLDVGITGDNDDGCDAAIDGKGAVGTVTFSTPSDEYWAAGGKYLAADDTVDIYLDNINTMTTAPVFDMWLYVEDVDASYTS